MIDQAYDRVVKLLTTEWLVSDVDLVVEGYCLFSPLLGSCILILVFCWQKVEGIRIRQIYVSEFFLRLHYMLFMSRQMIPEYVCLFVVFQIFFT